MQTDQPITNIIQQRYSCRIYRETPIDPRRLTALIDYAATRTSGPLGSSARFQIIASGEGDQKSLKGLGTYGAIKNPTGFIIGAIQQAPNDLEDYGYLLEQILLVATSLEIGTCWLGGTFNRSTFARKIALQPSESMPAVSSLGVIGSKPGQRVGVIRSNAGGTNRLPWQQLFFASTFNNPLSQDAAGVYRLPLEMVRVGPSASNKQPWRIVRQDGRFHFYLARTPGYHNPGLSLLKIPDLQRVDMGIAMCHFEMSAAEGGLQGKWVREDPCIAVPNKLTEYGISFYETPS
jgi:hypothetical protein